MENLQHTEAGEEKNSSGLDFETVLSPKATQLLKTIFEKNSENQAVRSVRTTTEIPTTPTDLTPDAQTLQMKTFTGAPPGSTSSRADERKIQFSTLTQSAKLEISNPPL